jgi:hypothetical protein
MSATNADLNGKLFLSAEGRIYRGIRTRSEQLFRRVIRSGLIESLAQSGLMVETWVCDRRIDGYPLVLEHSKIPYVSYSSEWSFEMLRAAALQVLALQRKLNAAGLQLHDCHCMNVLFRTTRPVYVDLTSLEVLSKSELWPALDEFCRWYLHPLAMAAFGCPDEARTLMGDYLRGIPVTLVQNLCPGLTANWSHLSFAGLQVNEKNRCGLIDALMREIADIPLRRRTTDWSEYYHGSPTAIEPADEWRPKQRRFYDILAKVRPKTLVDIGSNRGVYGQIAARLGIRVAAFDRDETAITDLYNDARDRDLEITPLVCDLMNPTPARGINGCWYPSVHERLHSDMAIALALVHHLATRRVHPARRHPRPTMAGTRARLVHLASFSRHLEKDFQTGRDCSIRSRSTLTHFL